MSVFGGSGFGQPQQSSNIFGGQPNNTNTGNTFGFGNQQQQPAAGQSSGFGGLGAKPATSTAFGQTNTQPSTGLFGQANKSAAPNAFGAPTDTKRSATGLFGSSTPAASGGLFGNSGASNTSTGFGLGTNTASTFGGSNSGSTGLFGNTANTAAQTGGATGGGGLFGQANQNQAAVPAKPLFGSSLGQTSSNTGGLFGNTNNTSTAAKPSGGLFGSSQPTLGAPGTAASTTGGGSLFGGSLTNSTASKPGLFGSTSGAAPLFGNAQNNTQLNMTQISAPPQQSLIASLDQASYILQGVAPAQKLYTSLSVPATKRSSQDSDIFNYESKPPVARNRIAGVRGTPTSRSSFLKPGAPKNIVTGPHLSNAAGKLISLPNAASNNEPRKWINSYESFIRERPTTLLIGRKAQIKSMKLVTDGNSGKLAPPVATAPPTAIEDINPPAGLEDSAMDHDRTLDPDVSLFHRQANNMTLVQVNPKAIEEGYYIYPRLEQLASMSKSELAAVNNLVIGRENYGKIEYPEPIDLSRLSNLGDILGKLVIFEAGIVCVYPDEGRKAPRGFELNMPATISIENAWPKDSETRAPITDMEDKRIIKHILKLKRICEERGSEFVTFTKGVWVFKVPHFSTWGLPADDMVIDQDEDDENEDEYLDDEDDKESEPLEPPVIVDSVIPHIASSPILSAFLDEFTEDMTEGEVGITGPQSWLEQLGHASKTVLLANAQSLEAASRSTDRLNLGSILMPASSNSSKKDSTTARDGVELSPEPRSFDITTAIAHLQPLRQLISKESRPTNDLPLIHSTVDFNRLASFHNSKKDLWRLLSLLYETPSEHNALEGLSRWFDDRVKSAGVNVRGDALDGIWQLLIQHDISSAYNQASDHSNLHLALLISMLTSKETRSIATVNAKQQLDDWKSTGFTNSIPVPIRRIWELAAGKLPGGTVLTWEQWLGIHLWYFDTASLKSAVQSLPSSLAGTKDAYLAFLQSYAGLKQLRTALNELNLVDAFICLQALFQSAPAAVKADIKGYDNICVKLSKALQDEKKYVDAVFVALHVTDSKTALQTIRKILIDMPSNINLPSEFGIQDPIIHEARALQVAKLGEFRSQCEHLVHAGLYDEAHKVLIAEVGPEAVLADKMQDIADLLVALEEHKKDITRWELGGGVYLTYAKVLQNGPDNYSVMSLCNACRYIATPTFESREAVSRISEWVASTSYAQRHISPDMILGMKFAPSQARIECLQQAAHLLY